METTFFGKTLTFIGEIIAVLREFGIDSPDELRRILSREKAEPTKTAQDIAVI